MFYKKYKFPINLFVIFEHLTPVVYTSEVLTPNHYVCVINNTWYYQLNIVLKKELFFNFNSLIELSAVDTLKYDNLLPDINIYLNNNRLLMHNTYYIYFTKLRLTFFYFYSLEHNKHLVSLDAFYKNANWLEREVSEMFSPIYVNKNDTRMLLLDYPKDDHPMLKDFPVESWGELYYDFLDKTLNYSDVIEHIEL